MKSKLLSVGLVLAVIALTVGGCSPAAAEPPAEDTPVSGGAVGLPNPASAYCEEQGYTLEIRTDSDGGEYGVCIFPDGSECEEWAFFRGECAPGGAAVEEDAPAEPPVPRPAESCAMLQGEVAQVLGVEVTLGEAPFVDPFGLWPEGAGCLLTATGTGVNFESFFTVAENLRALLASKGWSEDIQYQADGPTGTAFGYRQENALALVSVGWQPSEEADCPEDQPITACELAPEQQLYTITLNLAELP